MCVSYTVLFFNFFKFYFIFKLYNIVLVLPYIEMNLPQAYMCSPSWFLLPPPSPYHPSGSFQCTSPKHPVSCIESGLATRFIYDIISSFSQIIPPSPSPTESKRLFYTSVSLLLSRIQGYRYHLSKFHRKDELLKVQGKPDSLNYYHFCYFIYMAWRNLDNISFRTPDTYSPTNFQDLSVGFPG